METFAEELHKFIATCQIHAAEDAHGPAALRDIAVRLTKVLPRPRTCADFLVLRSLLTEFAARALRRCGLDHASAAILPLVQVAPPDGDLAAAFLHCMCVPPRSIAVAITDLRLRRAMAVITARLGDPGLAAGSVATAIGVSEPYFAKLLHAHCGCGFRTLVRRTRLEAARQRLERSLDRVKEVAASVGYASTSQLDRDFRRAYHTTPGQHRRRRHDDHGTMMRLE